MDGTNKTAADYVMTITTLIVAAAQNGLNEASMLEPILKPADSRSVKS